MSERNLILPLTPDQQPHPLFRQTTSVLSQETYSVRKTFPKRLVARRSPLTTTEENENFKGHNFGGKLRRFR